MTFKEKLDKNNIPKHIAIIMDGNGRWAQQRGGIRLFGHKNGANTVNEIVEASVEIGVSHLTLYAFSTENWNRPTSEITGLMNLLISTIETKLEKLIKYNVRLSVIGQINLLPEKVQTKLSDAINRSGKNTGLHLILALSYSAKWEITEAVKQIATEVAAGNMSVDSISSDTINKHLTTFGVPDPELLIRTSGELRISNFLLWQIAYSELYFTEKLWPDFTKDDYYQAIYDYQQRERRFGKTGEQIKNENNH
jgi:undecaprenyl diphosphate synthase